jgi:hypothetical protein
MTYVNVIMSRDGVVGIATRYGLEGPGIESRWGETFRTYPDRLRGPQKCAPKHRAKLCRQMVVRDSEPGRLVRCLDKYLVSFVHFGGSWTVSV